MDVDHRATTLISQLLFVPVREGGYGRASRTKLAQSGSEDELEERRKAL